MSDPIEQKLQRTRQRSSAATRHKFEFFGDNQRAVFPIVKRDDAGTITLCGTGFFVAPGGVFATAKHIFEGNDVRESDSFEILQEGVGHVEPRSILEVITDEASDLAVGRLKPAHNECLSCKEHTVVGIMQLDPEIHEVVGSFVFAHTLIDRPKNVEMENGVVEFQNVRLRSHWEVGLTEKIYPNGLGFVKGPCFGTSMFVEGRGSGGPVFNSNGFVIGVNSRSFAEPDGLPHSTCVSIKRLYEIRIGGKPVADWRRDVDNDRIESSGCAYLMVIERVEWPNILLTATMFAPFSIIRVAAVCLRS